MTKTYEVRTRSNRAIAAFDNLHRAIAHLAREQDRIGIPLRMVEVTRTEQEILL